MEIVLLGSPGVRVDGERVSLAGRQQALLAVLAMHSPRPVSSARLLDTVWVDELPHDPANALQQRISALRKIVDPHRTGTVLVATPGGYALRVDDERIDARRFTRLAEEGRKLLQDGDLTAARARLAAALALWHGPALDGFAAEPWALAPAQRLGELHLGAVEDRIAADLGLGAGVELVAELTELCTRYPLRERACGQLLRALYRAGRQGDAVAHYAATRARLAEDLGVNPGPDLQRIYRQLLTHADIATPAAPPQPPAPGNLPAASGRVIGRDTAIAQLVSLLANARLVTLTGPGGAGKTTLALEAARRQATTAGGAWLVELAPLGDGSSVTQAVAVALGVSAGGLGGTSIDADGLAGTLAGRRLLVVLDNCEHVIDDVAALVDKLLARAPDLRVLATSREPLGLAGELLWSVPPLGVPEPGTRDIDAILAAPAVELLVDRIRTHHPDLELNAEGAAAAAVIARRLDGVPLAIELAAARARVLALPELAAGLDDRFTLLTSRRGGPSRQRTLRDTLDWSWELLNGRQRTGWAVLSVPVDWFTQATAGRLLHGAGLTGSPLEALADLVERCLLTADTTVAPTRYRMLETIRAYGQQRLAELHLGDVVRASHADVVADGLAACHDTADPAAFPVDLAGLARWLDEARSALGWASSRSELARVQTLAGRLGWLWLLKGLAAEGTTWLDRGLGAIDGAPPPDLTPAEADTDALLWASALRATGATAHAHEWAAHALAAYLSPQNRIMAEVFAAVHHAHAGDAHAARAGLSDAVTHARAIGGWPLAFAYLISAQIGRMSGHHHDVHDHAQAALELLGDVDADWARVNATDIVIDELHNRGDFERARELARDGLTLCRAQGVPELEARMLLQLAVATHELGEHQLAQKQLDQAVQLSAAAGGGPGLGYTLVVAGTLARRRGDLDTARQQLGQARKLLAGTQTRHGTAWATIELGHTAALAGAAGRALSLSTQGLTLAQQLGDPVLLARALAAAGAAAMTAGDIRTAITVLAAGAALGGTPGVVIPPSVTVALQQTTAMVQQRAPDEFARRWRPACDNANADVSGAINSLVRQLTRTH